MRQLFLTCLLLTWLDYASATTIMLTSFDELVSEADGIVIGTVAETPSRYGPDREIYTFVRLADLELIKGHYGQGTLTVRIQGGEVEGEVLEIVGAPSFTPGDRVVVFLRGNGRYIVPFVGWTQGVYRVTTNSAGIAEVLDHDGNRVFGIHGTEISKERRFEPAASFVRGPRGVSRSTLPRAGSTSGSEIPPASDPVTAQQSGSTPMPSWSACPRRSSPPSARPSRR